MPYRSLLPWTLSLLLGVLVAGGFGLTASAQDGSGTPPQCTPSPGVACIRVSAAVQADIVKERIALAEAVLAELRPEVQGGSDVQDPVVTALNTEITTLKARLAVGFTDYDLAVPYATVRGPGQNGLAFSKFTYRDAGSASTSVGVEAADPTQIVLWGQATNENVAKAFKGERVSVGGPARGPRELQRYTRLPDNAYLWEGDRSDAHQYVAMQNSADPVAGEWVWVKSSGFHPRGDIPVRDTRHHMRFFSSSDNRIDDSPLGAQKGHFGYWTVIAAHYEKPTPLPGPNNLPTTTDFSWKKFFAEIGFSHKVVSWDEGQERVVDSITIPLVGGARQGMSWVKTIERRDWGNQGLQQDVNYTLDGYLIKMAAPEVSTLVAPSKPAAPTLMTRRNTITVEKPGGKDPHDGTWFDLQYRKGRGSQPTYGNWKSVDGIFVAKYGEIEDLEYDTPYQVRVRRYNARGRSGWSDASAITTEENTCGLSATPELVADCETLLAAKDTLRGSASLNWSADLDIDDWEGVTVVGGRVTKLELGGRKGRVLSGTIPAALGNLTALEHLSLSANQLTGYIPGALGKLTNLTYLSLSANRLSPRPSTERNEVNRSIPRALGDLTKLEHLSLSNNLLRGPIPVELRKLTALQSLSLNNNFLSGEIPADLEKLASLEHLNLKNNLLEGQIPLELLKLQNLERLFLNQATLTGCVPPFAVATSDLASFSLPACTATELCTIGKAVEDTDADPGLVQDCAVLLTAQSALNADPPLNWSPNRAIKRWHGVSVGDTLVLGVMTERVRALRMEGTGSSDPGSSEDLHSREPRPTVAYSGELSGIIPPALGQLVELRELTLTRHSLRGPIPELESLTHLTTLKLHGNQLTGRVPEELANLANLTTLKLRNNDGLEDCIPPALFDVADHDLGELRISKCPTVSIARVAASVEEGEEAEFTVTRTGRRSKALVVLVSVSDGDHDILDGAPAESVRIAKNARTATLVVATDDDETDEDDGLVTATIGASDDYTIDADADDATVTVTDDDLPEVSIVAVAASVEEGEDAEYTVTRTGRTADALTVKVSVSDGDHDVLDGAAAESVTIAADATSATLVVATDDDETDEDDVLVTATIGASADYAIDADAAAATVTVTDNDLPEVGIVRVAASVEEGEDAEYTVTRRGSTSAELTVKVSVSDGDHDVLEGTPRETVTIAVGHASATLAVATDDDETAEDDALVTVTIGTSDDYTIDAAAAAATVTVTDDGDLPEVGIAAVAASVEEGADATFTVTRVGSTSAELVVKVSVSDGDHDVLEGVPAETVTIAVGDASATLAVATDNDEEDESNGLVTATIGTSAAYAIDAANGSDTVTVRDNDTHPCENGTTVLNPRFNRGLVADCKALLAAKDVLQGDGVSVLNWGPTTRLDRGWTGVRVIQFRVWSLSLPNRGLGGEIPAALGALSDLFILALNGNELTGGVPAELGQLSKLYSLALNDNELRGQLPGSLQDLGALRRLSLRDNAFTGCIPPLLRNVGNNDVASLNLPDCMFGVEETSFATSGVAGYAKAGDTITVSFTTSAALAAKPSAMIAGQTATVSGSGTSWGAVYTVQASDTNGEARFDLGEIRDASSERVNPPAVGTGIVVDTVAPRLTAGRATPSGGAAKAGDSIRVPFTVSEALASRPVVRIAGEKATVSGSGTSWTASYTVQATDPNGAAVFDAEVIRDRAGNETDPPAVTTVVTVDTVAPTVTAYRFSASSGTSTVKAGGTIGVSFTTSEALASAPMASLAGTTVVVSGSGTSWSASLAVKAGVNIANVAFDLGTIRDAAGNEADPDAELSGIAIVDDVKPTATVAQATTTNEDDGYAKEGDTIRVPFTVSEVLASEPTATIAGQRATVTGAGRSWTASYRVTSTTADGAAAFNLGVLRDPVGNETDPAAAATGIEVDTVAPTVTARTVTTSAAEGEPAGEGDTITVAFTTSEPLKLKPWATIAGKVASITGAGRSWTAAYTVERGVNTPNAGFNLGTLRDAAGNTHDPSPVATGVAVETVVLHTLRTSVTPPDSGGVRVVVVAEYQGGQADGDFIGQERDWEYRAGTVVKAIAGANPGYRFKEWSGEPCQDVTNPHRVADGCRITLSSDKGVTAIFERRTYAFTVTADAGGTVSGGGTYEHGKPATGRVTWNRVQYTFEGWTGPCVTTSSSASSASCSVSMNGPRSVHADIDEKRCHVATDTQGSGTASGDATVQCGVSSVPIRATAGANACFTGWLPSFGRYSGGSSTAQPCATEGFETVVKPEVDYTYTAIFVTGYTITATHGPNGDVLGGGHRYLANKTVTLTAVPDNGYEVASWSGACSGSALTCDVRLTTNKSARVTFKEKPTTYSLTVTADAGGTPSGGGTKTARMTVTAAVSWDSVSYQFTGWTGPCASTTSGASSATCSVFMNSDKAVHADIDKKICHVDTATQGSGTAGGDDAVQCGVGSVPIRATAGANACFTGWSPTFGRYSGGSSTAQPCATEGFETVVKPEVDYTYTAIFATGYTITATHGPNGDVLGGGHRYLANETVTLTAVPDNGYEVASWSGASCGTALTCDVRLTTNKDVRVTFKKKPTNYTITISKSGSGTVLPAPGTYTRIAGSTLRVTATPADGWQVSSWSSASGCSSPVTTCNVAVNANYKHVRVTFERITHTLTISHGSNGSTSPAAGTHSYYSGTPETVTAIPNSGYQVNRWSGNCSGDSTSCDLTMNGNRSVRVTFELKPQCTLTVTDETGGSAFGSWTGECGTTRPISATLESGYRFDGWTGGSGVSNRSALRTNVVVSRTMTVRANFVSQCIVNVSAGPGGRASGGGTVDCGQSAPATATANDGYCFSRWLGGRLSGQSQESQEVVGQQSCRTEDRTRRLTDPGPPGVYSYVANFHVKPPSSFTLTVTADSGGTPSGGGSKPARQAATAAVSWNNVSYQFTSWTGAFCSSSSVSTSRATCSVYMSSNKSVHANLDKRFCRVTARTSTGGTASGGGNVHCGVGSTTVSARAGTGYCFTGWSVGLGSSVVGQAASSVCTVSNTRPVNLPRVDLTYTAQFEARNYTLTVNNGSGSGSYPARSYAVATAPARKCQFGFIYTFSGWTGTSVSSRSARLYMSSDRTVTANYATRTTETCFGAASEGETEEVIIPETEPLPAGEAASAEEQPSQEGGGGSADGAGEEPAEPEGEGSGGSDAGNGDET